MSMPPINSIVRRFLVSYSAITDLVSDRVSWPRLIKEYKIGDGPAISFDCTGGHPSPEHAEVSPRIQFKCWAATSEAARELYAALVDTLKAAAANRVDDGAGGTLGYITTAIEDNMGQDIIDPDTHNWPYVLTFWRVHIVPGD